MAFVIVSHLLVSSYKGGMQESYPISCWFKKKAQCLQEYLSSTGLISAGSEVF